MFIPHTTVVHKTIVYSDTVLPVKDTGNNLKITSIANVDEESLESCLEKIFESNPNVIFNTIQYSRKDKKVYFYTNQDITTKACKESKFTSYKPITSRTEILEELKRVLHASKNKDADCISLYDVLVLLKKLRSEYRCLEEGYENNFNYIVHRRFNVNSAVVYHGFDYEKNILHISFKKYRGGHYDDIYFAKQNGDLYIVNQKSLWSDEVFSALCSSLSEMYDELLKYADYKDYMAQTTNRKPINSNFNVSISNHGIIISVKDFNSWYGNELELSASSSYEDGYELKCNSSIVINAFRGNEEEVFRRIYVKISDCPEWCQSILYETRQNQLATEQRKEKKLALARKFFPIFKK